MNYDEALAEADLRAEEFHDLMKRRAEEVSKQLTRKLIEQGLIPPDARVVFEMDAIGVFIQ